MMGKKKLADVKAEVAALLARLPGGSPRQWLEKDIASARRNAKRDVQILEALCAALEKKSGKAKKTKARRKAAKR